MVNIYTCTIGNLKLKLVKEIKKIDLKVQLDAHILALALAKISFVVEGQFLHQ